MSEMGHKPGCLMGDDCTRRHRIPIDCVTEAALWLSIDNLKKDVAEKDKEIVKLKVRIFDLMEEEEE
jgi:hypothetical protein